MSDNMLPIDFVTKISNDNVEIKEREHILKDLSSEYQDKLMWNTKDNFEYLRNLNIFSELHNINTHYLYKPLLNLKSFRQNVKTLKEEDLNIVSVNPVSDVDIREKIRKQREAKLEKERAEQEKKMKEIFGKKKGISMQTGRQIYEVPPPAINNTMRPLGQVYGGGYIDDIDYSTDYNVDSNFNKDFLMLSRMKALMDKDHDFKGDKKINSMYFLDIVYNVLLEFYNKGNKSGDVLSIYNNAIDEYQNESVKEPFYFKTVMNILMSQERDVLNNMVIIKFKKVKDLSPDSFFHGDEYKKYIINIKGTDYIMVTMENTPVSNIFDLNKLQLGFQDNIIDVEKLYPLFYDVDVIEGKNIVSEVQSGEFKDSLHKMHNIASFLDPADVSSGIKSSDFTSPAKKDISVKKTQITVEELDRIHEIQNIEFFLSVDAIKCLMRSINTFFAMFGSAVRVADIQYPSGLTFKEYRDAAVNYVKTGTLPDDSYKGIKFPIEYIKSQEDGLFKGIKIFLKGSTVAMNEYIELCHFKNGATFTGDTTINNVKDFINSGKAIYSDSIDNINFSSKGEKLENQKRIWKFAKIYLDGMYNDNLIKKLQDVLQEKNRGKTADYIKQKTLDYLLQVIIVTMKGLGDAMQVNYAKQMSLILPLYKDVLSELSLSISSSDKNTIAESFLVDLSAWSVGGGLYADVDNFRSRGIDENILETFLTSSDYGNKTIITSSISVNAEYYYVTILNLILTLSSSPMYETSEFTYKKYHNDMKNKLLEFDSERKIVNDVFINSINDIVKNIDELMIPLSDTENSIDEGQLNRYLQMILNKFKNVKRVYDNLHNVDDSSIAIKQVNELVDNFFSVSFYEFLINKLEECDNLKNIFTVDKKDELVSGITRVKELIQNYKDNSIDWNELYDMLGTADREEKIKINESLFNLQNKIIDTVLKENYDELKEFSFFNNMKEVLNENVSTQTSILDSGSSDPTKSINSRIKWFNLPINNCANFFYKTSKYTDKVGKYKPRDVNILYDSMLSFAKDNMNSLYVTNGKTVLDKYKVIFTNYADKMSSTNEKFNNLLEQVRQNTEAQQARVKNPISTSEGKKAYLDEILKNNFKLPNDDEIIRSIPLYSYLKDEGIDSKKLGWPWYPLIYSDEVVITNLNQYVIEEDMETAMNYIFLNGKDYNYLELAKKYLLSLEIDNFRKEKPKKGSDVEVIKEYNSKMKDMQTQMNNMYSIDTKYHETVINKLLFSTIFSYTESKIKKKDLLAKYIVDKNKKNDWVFKAYSKVHKNILNERIKLKQSLIKLLRDKIEDLTKEQVKSSALLSSTEVKNKVEDFLKELRFEEEKMGTIFNKIESFVTSKMDIEEEIKTEETSSENIVMDINETIEEPSDKIEMEINDKPKEEKTVKMDVEEVDKKTVGKNKRKSELELEQPRRSSRLNKEMPRRSQRLRKGGKSKKRTKKNKKSN